MKLGARVMMSILTGVCISAGADQRLPSIATVASGAFQVATDLQIDELLAEPTIAQPVFLNFDERGRMWVVEYRQYPHPAGVKVMSHDHFWRAVYDKVPSAPPHHDKGADRISIHEDTDGDGSKRRSDRQRIHG